MKYRLSIAFLSAMTAAWVLGTLAIVRFNPRSAPVNSGMLFPFLSVIIVVWVAGTAVAIYNYPRVAMYGIKRALTRRGVDAGSSAGIPVNTLYAVPNRASPTATSPLVTTGTDDAIYVIGWLELASGPLVLHVPAFGERYYSVQLTGSADGANFAYVGTRATGAQAGDYLIAGPGWQGQAPGGMARIASPGNSVLVIGRVRVEGDEDVPAAYGLSKQIQVTPLLSQPASG